jgi:hypothetical protein
MLLSLWVALASASLAADPAPPAAPTLPDGSVVFPAFTVGGHAIGGGGMAFYARLDGKAVVVTAFQLLGPPSKLPAQIAAADVAKQVTSVALVDAWNRKSTGVAGPAFTVVDAAPMSQGAAHDLAVFDVSISGFDTITNNPKVEPPHPLDLAPADPKVGDIVWLAAPVNGAPPDVHLHAAKVAQVDANALYVEFAEKALDLAGTAGAPLIDAQGRVVGMCVGGGTMDGVVVGGANPVGAMRARIAKAIAGK